MQLPVDVPPGFVCGNSWITCESIVGTDILLGINMEITILRQIQRDGRISWAALAGLLGVTGPAIAERVRKLEERGVIRGYTALLDPTAVGYSMLAFVAVRLEHPGHRSGFLAQVDELPEILECHHVSGEDDYLLKIVSRDTRDLDRILVDGLQSVEGVARTRTTIVLSTAKETPSVPVAEVLR